MIATKTAIESRTGTLSTLRERSVGREADDTAELRSARQARRPALLVRLRKMKAALRET
jgi:hypothetical protein